MGNIYRIQFLFKSNEKINGLSGGALWQENQFQLLLFLSSPPVTHLPLCHLPTPTQKYKNFQPQAFNRKELLARMAAPQLKLILGNTNKESLWLQLNAQALLPFCPHLPGPIFIIYFAFFGCHRIWFYLHTGTLAADMWIVSWKTLHLSTSTLTWHCHIGWTFYEIFLYLVTKGKYLVCCFLNLGFGWWSRLGGRRWPLGRRTPL